MKKTPAEIVETRQIALPTKNSTRIVRFLLKRMISKSNVEYKYLFDKEKMKNEQVIILADHATKDAYKYVISGYPFANPNIVIGYQNIFVKGLFKLLLNGGIIPKKLYQADSKSVIEMLKVLKMGGSLCIFPEGIQSSSGSTHPIFSGTAKLLKKALITVVLCKSYGSYLVKPRYKKKEHIGKQEYHYEILFTKEELIELTVEEIYNRLLERFKYNDFDWNKEAKNKYSCKNGYLADGIESLLYYCPKCHKEFTLKNNENDIVCEHCGNTITINEYYEINPKTKEDVLPYKNIDDWYKHQRKLVKEEVKNNIFYQYECQMYDLHTDKLSFKPYYCCGEGVITITNDYIIYKGTRHSENVELKFDINRVASYIFTPNQDNDLYYDNIYYSFRPKENRLMVVKYMLLVEELHRLKNPTWDKLSADVYD